MGLRFRKSIKICKGVRLNLGKSGASVSVGGRGFRKTFHSSGKVTTTIVLPGTGIYWTETEKPSNVNKNNTHTLRNHFHNSTVSSNISEYESRSVFADHDTQPDNISYEPIWLMETSNENIRIEEPVLDEFTQRENELLYESIQDDTDNVIVEIKDAICLSPDIIREIYTQCDESIDWGEILAGTSADELMMDRTLWAMCRDYCGGIMRGDVDAYLDVIETFKPVSDLMLYAGDFEFGTNNSSYIETEFQMKQEELFDGGIAIPLLKQFVYAIAIRVSRDLMALLPVKKVLMHVVYDDLTIFSSIMDRDRFGKCDFMKNSLETIVESMDYTTGISDNSVREVDRKSIIL